jgi:hypothetical protein
VAKGRLARLGSLSLLRGSTRPSPAIAWRTPSASRSHAPVLCVGNFTVGGAGKTPVAIALAREARRQRLNPGFLSRGYGGAIYAPHLVDAETTPRAMSATSRLCWRRSAPTVVTPNRKDGAELLIAHGCDFIIMDDGFQSAQDPCRLRASGGRFRTASATATPCRRPHAAPARRPDAPCRRRRADGRGTAAEKVIRQAARAGRPVYDATARPRASLSLGGRPWWPSPGSAIPKSSSAPGGDGRQRSPWRAPSPTTISIPTTKPASLMAYAERAGGRSGNDGKGRRAPARHGTPGSRLWPTAPGCWRSTPCSKSPGHDRRMRSSGKRWPRGTPGGPIAVKTS